MEVRPLHDVPAAFAATRRYVEQPSRSLHSGTGKDLWSELTGTRRCVSGCIDVLNTHHPHPPFNMASLLTLERPLRRRIFLDVDLKSLLVLRQCSSDYLDIVVDELQDQMEDVVAPFVPHPRSFLNFISTVNAFVGGSALIPFFVRDARYRANALEVYAPFLQLIPLCNHLQNHQCAREEDDFGSDDDFEDYLPHRGARSITRYGTPVGTVNVICSRFDDPLTPIACSWSSLHFGYANAEWFGHGYPHLTLHRRGIIGDGVGEEEEVCGRMGRFLRRGFDLRMTARAWPEYAQHYPCPHAKFVCPTQPRYFKDTGAMACRMWPLGSDRVHTTVMWRMDFRPCGGPCLDISAGEGILGPYDHFAAL